MDRPIDNFDQIFRDFHSKEEELIPLLQRVQNVQGFISVPAMKRIAAFLRIPESRVFSVATFYAQFRFAPAGKKHIMLCRGTACHVKNAARVLEEIENQLGITPGETTVDMEYSLETVACIGACSLAPCLVINDEVKANLTPKIVKKMFMQEKKKTKERAQAGEGKPDDENC
jgi:NADH-quinone oxidoreductase subunit E